MEKRLLVRRDGSKAKFEYVLEGTTYFAPVGKAAKQYHPYWAISSDTGKPFRTNEIDKKVLDEDYRMATEIERAKIAPMFDAVESH